MRQNPSLLQLTHALRFTLISSLAAILLSPIAKVAADEVTFPYKARICRNNTYVRSGPGKNYYPTDKLPAGKEIEVYRHDPGGWYAIRPPEGSFCWVASRWLKHGDDGLAEIAGNRVAARVGSRFSNIRDVVQVRLSAGEIVEPLDSSAHDRSRSAAVQGPAWVKIAPPAGEFRWVSAEHVERHRQETSGAISSEDLQQRLEDIDLELSVMVAEEPTVWQFDELALEVESLFKRAETPLQRGRARILLGKIDRFANIKQRYDSVNSIRQPAFDNNSQLAAVQGRYEPSGTGFRRCNDALGEHRFDGYGRLTRVVSPKPGAPRYALLDETGGVHCYVTPAPGVNLRYYEQRLIGVNGTRGYVPEQRAAHVMAQHVNLLDDTLHNNSATKLR